MNLDGGIAITCGAACDLGRGGVGSASATVDGRARWSLRRRGIAGALGTTRPKAEPPLLRPRPSSLPGAPFLRCPAFAPCAAPPRTQASPPARPARDAAQDAADGGQRAAPEASAAAAEGAAARSVGMQTPAASVVAMRAIAHLHSTSFLAAAGSRTTDPSPRTARGPARDARIYRPTPRRALPARPRRQLFPAPYCTTVTRMPAPPALCHDLTRLPVHFTSLPQPRAMPPF